MCGQGWPLLGSESASLTPSSRRPSLAYGWGSPCVFTLSSFSVSKLPFLFFNFIRTSDILGASVVAQLVRIHLQCRRPGFNPWVGKIPWRRAWQPTLVFLPGESPLTEEPDGLHTVHGVAKSWTRLRDWTELKGCLVTQSCLTLCDFMDCSLPGSS